VAIPQYLFLATLAEGAEKTAAAAAEVVLKTAGIL
jgi:hypothetical protein